MVILILALLGGLLGWLANTVMRTDDRQGALLSVTIGVAGALMGGLLFHGTDGVWAMSFGRLGVGAMLAASASATILLLVARFARVTG